ncbi:hypothetical protein K505DRAFT_328632 [Melanomma pulvis-pyrius CBS 109.77]|uniref:Uncharacterized protein n=1 Tax=Melanomma pulvis-pyrius CBS 109.77 TaxID=1314802 RepID=A0A6A6WY60_9PLEO|nr:hypothetical protein K505DRAFT_328632 [Melanomma pulvis-pyrius CBS 109.77]
MATENLYVVKRTFVDPKKPTASSFNIELPSTFTDLEAAKEYAKPLLANEGFDTEFFSEYDVKDGSKEWKHDDSIMVYAKGPAGELFKVEIDVVPNLLGLQPDASGRVQQQLYHVLQTDIEYDEDRSGSQRYTIVEGSYATRESAREQALRALLDADVKKEDFVEYDEYADGKEGPFGEDVVVHAVKEGGQNVLVSVISDHK